MVFESGVDLFAGRDRVVPLVLALDIVDSVATTRWLLSYTSSLCLLVMVRRKRILRQGSVVLDLVTMVVVLMAVSCNLEWPSTHTILLLLLCRLVSI